LDIKRIGLDGKFPLVIIVNQFDARFLRLFSPCRISFLAFSEFGVNPVTNDALSIFAFPGFQSDSF